MTEGRVRQSDLAAAIDDVQDRLKDLEAMVDDLPNDVSKVAEGDDMPLKIGGTYCGIISDDGTGTKHGDPMTHANGVVTFLNSEQEVGVGDEVEFVISETGENHAKGAVTEVNPDD